MQDIPRRASRDEVPVIDLDAGDADTLAATLRQACLNSAFFYVANHGVGPALVDGAFSQAWRFFERPLEQRAALGKNRFHRGYIPLGTTQYPGRRKDLKDSFNVGVDLPLDDPDVVAGLPLHGPNHWPEDLPGFREPVEAYFNAVKAAGLRVLRVLARSLDMPTDFYEQFYTKPTVLTRLVHYPEPEKGEAADFGIGAQEHTDYGNITLLAQDPGGGLEIRMPNGEWISAPYIEGTFVVNLGDLAAHWTNNVYRSNLHRVVNRLGRARLSIPTFMNPNHYARVECIPTCMGPGNPAQYEPVLAGDYIAAKVRANQGYRAPPAAA